MICSVISAAIVMLADAERAARLLVHLEQELSGRCNVRDVSHELLRKIQGVPNAMLAHCLKRHQILK